MKRVLAVTAQPIEYNTSSMLRILRIVNGLVNNGYYLELLTQYPTKDNKYYSEDMYIDERVTVCRFGPQKSIIEKIGNADDSSIKNRILTTLRNVYKNIDLFGSSIELLNCQKELQSMLANKHYDYLISFSSPITAHIIANKIYRHFEKIGAIPFYIQQWGDPLTLDITNTSIIPKFAKRIIEKKIIFYADKIIYVSPITVREQQKMFPQAAHRMKFIPPPTKASWFNVSVNTKRKVTFGYYGSYYSIARNLKPLYESVKNCNDVGMIIVGDSDINLQPVSYTHLTLPTN